MKRIVLSRSACLERLAATLGPDWQHNFGAVRLLSVDSNFEACVLWHFSSECLHFSRRPSLLYHERQYHRLVADSADDEDGNRRPVRAQNKRLKGEVGRHKAELESLKERDPEFFKFLQETDAELLEFDEGDDEGDSGEDSDEAEPAPAAAQSDEVRTSRGQPSTPRDGWQ